MMQALPLRYVGPAALAVATTIALFLTMKVLVTGQEYQIEAKATALAIDFVRLERDEDVNVKNRGLKRPSQEQPEAPPPPPKLRQTQRPNIDNASMAANLGDFDLSAMNLNAPVDGDALAIVRVLPRYPSRALSRGIEGWVLIEFAINQLGQAININIVDAEPAGMFDRSAIAAVKKWKYRPMMADGKPAIRQAVRQKISYRISK